MLFQPRLEMKVVVVQKVSGSMKKMCKWFKTLWKDLFGWDCPQCKNKSSVYFYDAVSIGNKRAEVYKCLDCGIEEWRWQIKK